MNLGQHDQSDGRRRARLRGEELFIRAGIVVAILAASGAGVWTVVHFGKPRPETAEKQSLPIEPPEPRLIGIWQTDADQTIAEMRKTRWVSDADELLMRRQAKTVIMFTATTVTMRPYSIPTPQPYEIVNKDGDTVVLKTWFEATKKVEEFPIKFDGKDILWFEAKMLSIPVKECFRRIILDAALDKYVPAAVP